SSSATRCPRPTSARSCAANCATRRLPEHKSKRRYTKNTKEKHTKNTKNSKTISGFFFVCFVCFVLQSLDIDPAPAYSGRIGLEPVGVTAEQVPERRFLVFGNARIGEAEPG